MASPNLSEIVTTTLRNRSGELVSQIVKGNALFAKMKEKGAFKSATGRSILQEISYQENQTFQYYSGGEVLNIASSDVITSPEYDWKQAAVAVNITGLEADVQNTGKEQIIDLMEARIKNAQETMRNQVTIGMYSDGTGSGGKQIAGLQLLIAEDPTTGTVGGISRATWSFWRNQKFNDTVDGTGATSATNIQGYMNTLYLRCTQGGEAPDLILMDALYYAFFWASLQAIQRITDTKMGKLGFNSLAYAKADVVYEDSTGIPASHAYFINTNHIYLRYAPKRFFKPLERVMSINQDAVNQFITFAGNMTIDSARHHGVLF